MKKLYFLNEEESIRILNLHKDATKRQYLKEDDNSKILSEQENPADTYRNFFIDGGEAILKSVPREELVKVEEPIVKITTTTPEVQKPVQSAPNPLVMDIQKKLKEKNINIGTTGKDKDGVDGVMGKKTLNGIIGFLGKPEPLKTIDPTTTPLTTKPTEDLMKPVTTTGTPVAGATAGTPTAGTPEAAAAAADKGENSSDSV